jgi:hypothetical protein
MRAVLTAGTVLLCAGLVTACSGGGSQQVAADTSASATATPTPTPSTPTGTATATADGPTPVTVAGYDYTQPPAEAVNQFAAVAKLLPQAFATPTVVGVAQDGQEFAALVLLGLDPSLVQSDPAFEDKIVQGMVGGVVGQGLTPQKESIAGQDVVTVSSDGVAMTAWYRDGTVALVMGDGAGTQVHDFVAAYIGAG